MFPRCSDQNHGVAAWTFLTALLSAACVPNIRTFLNLAMVGEGCRRGDLNTDSGRFETRSVRKPDSGNDQGSCISVEVVSHPWCYRMKEPGDRASDTHILPPVVG